MFFQMKAGPQWLCALFALALALVMGCSSESRKARHLERGERYFRAEAFERAELEYLNALRLDPANTPATRSLALIYFEQGKPSEAYPMLMRAAETSVKYPSPSLTSRRSSTSIERPPPCW